MDEKGVELDVKVGTMIEIPRAAVTADEIAEEAQFFSFGTNDLTQMTFGFFATTRPSSSARITTRRSTSLIRSPALTRTASASSFRWLPSSASRPPDIVKLGICGEHGGDPSSVMFCHKVGLNYVSCSPFRVPIARLAAAHAAILEKQGQL